MTLIYIAIGSNLNNPLIQVNSAISALYQIPNSRIVTISSFYRSKPMGPPNQPQYLNIVVSLETNLVPDILLNYTQLIELKHGRIRTVTRWGARTLDLDLILYGQQIIRTKNLIIPHYGLKNREFMLYPLSEISPKLRFPDGELLSDRLTLVPKNGLTLW